MLAARLILCLVCVPLAASRGRDAPPPENDIIAKLEAIENNLNQKIQEAVDKIVKQTLADWAVKQKPVLDIVSNVNNRLDNVNQRMDNVNERLDNVNNRLDNVNHRLDGMNKGLDGVSSKMDMLRSDLQQFNNLKTVVAEVVNSTGEVLCDVSAPSTAPARSDVWKYEEVPEMDDLDKYMTDKTGCRYLGAQTSQLHVFSNASLDGALELRAAVRTRSDALLAVQWRGARGDKHEYRFLLGSDNNVATSLTQQLPAKKELATARTPALLDEEAYVPFYIALDPQEGTLSLGKLCEGGPLVEHAVSVKSGTNVMVRFGALAAYGGKLLYDCPPPAEEAAHDAARK